MAINALRVKTILTDIDQSTMILSSYLYNHDPLIEPIEIEIEIKIEERECWQKLLLNIFNRLT